MPHGTGHGPGRLPPAGGARPGPRGEGGGGGRERNAGGRVGEADPALRAGHLFIPTPTQNHFPQAVLSVHEPRGQKPSLRG